MKVINETKAATENESTFYVKPLIDQLIRVILHSSTQKGIVIINDVNPGLKTKCDLNILALVLGNLINEAACFSENDCLRINSSENGEIIVSSKKNNLAKNRSFMVSIDSLQIIAERLGTPVYISGSFNNGVEIFVRFNKKAA